jgi:putative iron-dependent peroxidase
MRPQAGIFIEGNANHWFLEFTIEQNDAVASALKALHEAAQGSVPTDTVQTVISFSPKLASRLFPKDTPDDPAFSGVSGPAHAAPASTVDLWVWLHSDRHDRNFDVALAARRLLAPLGELVEETVAWQYHDSRDLTGFIDGTENPNAEEGRSLAVIAEGPGAGGCHVFSQRWVHDLDAFHALDESEQERVFGRTKPDSVELDPIPDNSHVGRVVIEDEHGEERELYRRSMPYGDQSESGLYFLAFPGDQQLIYDMVDRMFGNDGPSDRLLEFSRPVSGAFTFAPSAEALATLLEAG